MQRRSFMQNVGAFGLLIFTLGTAAITTGCGFFTDISTWGPVGLAAFNSIVTLLETSGIPFAANIVAIVREAFAQLIADAKQYEALNPPPVGAKAELIASLQIIITNFQAFLSSLQLTGGLLSLIAGLASIIIAAIKGFMGQPAGAGLKLGIMRIGQRELNPKAKLYKHTGSFKRDFNAVCKSSAVSGAAAAELPLTLGEHF